MRRRMNLSLFLVALAMVPGNVMGGNLRGKQVLKVSTFSFFLMAYRQFDGSNL